MPSGFSALACSKDYLKKCLLLWRGDALSFLVTNSCWLLKDVKMTINVANINLNQVDYLHARKPFRRNEGLLSSNHCSHFSLLSCFAIWKIKLEESRYSQYWGRKIGICFGVYDYKGVLQWQVVSQTLEKALNFNILFYKIH